MLRPIVPKFRPDLYACFKDVVEKQVPFESETDGMVIGYIIPLWKRNIYNNQDFPNPYQAIICTLRDNATA